MGFSFYPKHEQNCPNVSHCPHWGGAALGTLVLMATANSAATSPTEKKKRGAPVGHGDGFAKRRKLTTGLWMWQLRSDVRIAMEQSGCSMSTPTKPTGL